MTERLQLAYRKLLVLRRRQACQQCKGRGGVATCQCSFGSCSCISAVSISLLPVIRCFLSLPRHAAAAALPAAPAVWLAVIVFVDPSAARRRWLPQGHGAGPAVLPGGGWPVLQILFGPPPAAPRADASPPLPVAFPGCVFPLLSTRAPPCALPADESGGKTSQNTRAVGGRAGAAQAGDCAAVCSLTCAPEPATAAWARPTAETTPLLALSSVCFDTVCLLCIWGSSYGLCRVKLLDRSAQRPRQYTYFIGRRTRPDDRTLT